ncbi:MAG: alpha/beta fold hydrolase [Aminipila sp.]
MSFFKYNSKDVYYTEIGEGKPIVLLHGNTASSKMFESVTDLYSKNYKVILIDFLGHGESQRLTEFPVELWFDEAMQTITLLDILAYEKVSLIGTSGGAWVALNVALERPDLVDKIIADSFDGRTLAKDFIKNLKSGREFSKQNELAKQFYIMCQGNDWESVVDNDNRCLTEFVKLKKGLFHRPLNELKLPLLLTASKTDDMIRRDCMEEYDHIINQTVNSQKYIFENGFHPAIISNGEEYAKIVNQFLIRGSI